MPELQQICYQLSNNAVDMREPEWKRSIQKQNTEALYPYHSNSYIRERGDTSATEQGSHLKLEYRGHIFGCNKFAVSYRTAPIWQPDWKRSIQKPTMVAVCRGRNNFAFGMGDVSDRTRNLFKTGIPRVHLRSQHIRCSKTDVKLRGSKNVREPAWKEKQ